MDSVHASQGRKPEVHSQMFDWKLMRCLKAEKRKKSSQVVNQRNKSQKKEHYVQFTRSKVFKAQGTTRNKGLTEASCKVQGEASALSMQGILNQSLGQLHNTLQQYKSKRDHQRLLKLAQTGFEHLTKYN